MAPITIWALLGRSVRAASLLGIDYLRVPADNCWRPRTRSALVKNSNGKIFGVELETATVGVQCHP